MIHDKKVFARFTGGEIFMEQGRLLFSLLNAFSNSGYQIKLYDNFGDRQLDKYGQLIHTLRGLELTATDIDPGEKEGTIYLYDKKDRFMAKGRWLKRIQVRFDLFSSFWLSSPIIMPFPMHPLQTETPPEQLEAYRHCERKLRVFFSGDTDHYGRNWIRYPKPKLARLTIVNAVKENLGARLVVINDAEDLNRLGISGYTNKCVITGSSKIRTEFREWLDTLAKADFFLSPPGIVMPMCHNIIEAMAVGTIPITNYPEWFDPHLEHMENCIAFDDLPDLISKMKFALELGTNEIDRLRSNVVRYYESFMKTDTFIRRIEAHPDHDFPILMYTERNVAKKSAKLGRSSILMHGTIKRRERSRLLQLTHRVLGWF